MSLTGHVSGADSGKVPVDLPAVPDHELLRRIGRGSYGEVWLARNILGENRAVKIVHRDTFESAHPFEREFEGIQRFEPISRSHESQMQILHVGRSADGASFYYIMELADDAPGARMGEAPSSYTPKTLRSAMAQRGRISPEECLEIALKLTSALAHLHQHGLVHRDIKPSNIIFVHGIPKLADIGLVAKADAPLSFVGTEGFVPPEGPGKPQADLYSLGKVLYEICTGRDRQDFPELPTDLRHQPDRDRLVEFNEIIVKACEPDLTRRYSSAQEMHEELLLLRAGKSLKHLRAAERRLKGLARASAVLTIIAMVVLAGFFYQRKQTEAVAAERQRAESTLAQMELLRVSEMLDREDANNGLIHLAQFVRKNPTNRFAAERLMAAVAQGNFIRPLLGPFRHDAQINSAAFSPDGRWFATAARDGVTRVWNSRDGALANTFQHQAEAFSVEFSPDSSSLVTVSADRTSQIWNFEEAARPLRTLQHSNSVIGATFSRDSRKILTLTRKQALVWDAQSGDLLATLAHNAEILAACFSPDSTLVGAALRDSTACVWDVSKGELAAPILRHDLHKLEWGGVTSIQFSPNSRWVLTAAYDDTARIWDAKTGKQALPSFQHKHPVQGARFNFDGTKVLTFSNDRTARLWDSTTGRELRSFRHQEGVDHASFDSSGQNVITREVASRRSARTIVRLWSVETDEMTDIWLPGPIDILIADSAKARMLAASSDTLWIYSTAPSACAPVALTHSNWVGFAQFSPDGKRLVTTEVGEVSTPMWKNYDRKNVSTIRSAWIWDVRSEKALTGPLSHRDSIVSAHFSPDGVYVATGSFDATAQIWNATTGLASTRPLEHSERVRFVRFAPSGSELVTSGWLNRAWFWKSSNGEMLLDLAEVGTGERSNPHMPVRSDDLSSDGHWLVTCSRDGARVWNVSNRKLYAGPFAAGENIYAARFNPLGTRLVVASISNNASVWEVATGRRVFDPFRHTDPVLFAAFSPDGQRVVTCSMDRTARIWDSASGKPLTKPLVHRGEVLNAEFSPDGRRLVTASWWDNAALLWDTDTGLLLSRPLQHDDWVNHATFSPDGHSIATASNDRTAKVWKIPSAPAPTPSWLPDLAEALVGRRLNADGLIEIVPVEQLVALRNGLTSSLNQDAYSEWAKSVLAYPSNSPSH